MGSALGHEPRLVTEARYAGSRTCVVRAHEAGRRWCGHVPVVMVWLSGCRRCSHWWPCGAGPHIRCRRDYVVSITWEPSFACNCNPAQRSQLPTHYTSLFHGNKSTVGMVMHNFEATGQISIKCYVSGEVMH
jgi:hypothetical protein